MSQQSLVQKLAAGPVQFVLDRGVQQSESARGLCEVLEGRALQIRTGIDSLDAYFKVSDGKLELLPGHADKPDAVLSGSPLQLARMIGNDPQSIIRDGDVKISGSTDIADDFQSLLYLSRPDLEEELSHVTGDVIAHEIGRSVRAFGEWLSRAERTLSRSAGEYLSEETRAVVTESELEEYCGNVDELASAVDRLEARLTILREQHSANRTRP